MALRDLARYRARSGSALGAIGLGVLIAATVCVAAAARYGNVLDYAGPNLANNQLNVYTPQAPPPPGAVLITPNGSSKEAPSGGAANTAQPSYAALLAKTTAIAAALGSHNVVELLTPDAGLVHEGSGRNFNGQLYVATPQLLHAFGISASEVQPTTDILTMRPGLASISNMVLSYGSGDGGSRFQRWAQRTGRVRCRQSSHADHPRTALGYLRSEYRRHRTRRAQNSGCRQAWRVG